MISSVKSHQDTDLIDANVQPIHLTDKPDLKWFTIAAISPEINRRQSDVAKLSFLSKFSL